MTEITENEVEASSAVAKFPWERSSELAGKSIQIDPKEHFDRQVGPIEHPNLDECPITIRNIGWTLGNDCPYRCTHCYSMSAREKGMNFSVDIIDRIVSELASNGVETVNLGGNEPLFTNGANPRDTLLPYILDALNDAGIIVGLTTSGITAIHLERDHNAQWRKLNDLDVSFDSPFEDEHNANRGAKIYKQAIRTLQLAKDYGIDHTVIMCGMNWNFTPRHIEAILELATKYDAHIRINPIKPVEPAHMDSLLTAEQYYEGFAMLMEHCDPIDLGEPPIAAVTDYQGAKGCPCGRTSFRIHSITPDGRIPVSPCVYLHDYKIGDLRKDSLYEIVRSPQFQSFRRRNANPEMVEGCAGCSMLHSCRGGCAGRSYLHNAHLTGKRSLFSRDPYCPRDVQPQQQFPQKPQVPTDIRLVHMDYLCTWIGKPRGS
jgi:radical SAM protein with 4Fe4S-binding SPASM domain